MKLIRQFMRVFFNLLYHPFAFTYDLVAAIVSFGKWKDWVFSVIPFIEGTRILELGHGPGHLQRNLLNRGLVAVAMDESAPMGIIAKRRLGSPHRLTRSLAQKIPFAAETFDTIISTFPSEYIYDMKTLSEAYRVLCGKGWLIVLFADCQTSPERECIIKIKAKSGLEVYGFIKYSITKILAQVDFKSEI